MSAAQTSQNFAKALNKLLDQHGLPAPNHGRGNAFAKLVGRPLSTTQRWVTGKALPSVEDMLSLCDIFHCSMDQLLGKIPIEREKQDRGQTSTVTFFSESGNVEIEIPSSFIPHDDLEHPLGMLRIATSEMKGYAEPNDRVFFDLADSTIRSGSVYVLRVSGRLAVRRLIIRLNQMVDVLCENQQYPAELVEPQRFKPADIAAETDISVLGRVIAKLNFDHS